MPAKKNGTSEPSERAASIQSMGAVGPSAPLIAARRTAAASRRSPAEAPADGNSLVQMKRETCRGAARSEGAHDQIVLAFESGVVGAEARHLRPFDLDPVVERDRDHDAAQRVVAVFSPREHFERKIELCRSKQYGHHASFGKDPGVRLRTVDKPMTPSYDAQRNEFCAYVLSENETPFGMTLGNFKTFATSTPKGAVRGLWDADTDQIIFGTHQIAYRVRDRERTLFPRDLTREFTFLPYAQISEFALDERTRVTECFYVPHGPEHDRAVAFVDRRDRAQRVDRTGGSHGFSLGADRGTTLVRRARERSACAARERYVRVWNRKPARSAGGEPRASPGGRRRAARAGLAGRDASRFATRRRPSRRGHARAGGIRSGPHLRRVRISR